MGLSEGVVLIMILDVGRLNLDLDPELHRGRANELSSKGVCIHSFLLWPMHGANLDCNLP